MSKMFKVTLYTDGEGREVKKLSPVAKDGKEMAGKPIFRGRTTLSVPGRPPMTVEFALPEDVTLADSFTRFDAELNTIMAAEAKQRMKNISVPAGPKLVGVDGRPLPVK